MKVLASVTILMAIPTIIGGIFGMNVPFPGNMESNPGAFNAIIIFTLLLTGGAESNYIRKICSINLIIIF